MRRGQRSVCVVPKIIKLRIVSTDLSPAYDYMQMVLSKSCTKAQLDNQLHVCRAFANAQIALIEDAIRDGSANIST